MIRKIKYHYGTKSYVQITGKQALRIWKAVYRNKAYTDRGSRWSWAEIITETRSVWITTTGSSHLLSKNPQVEINIGLYS